MSTEAYPLSWPDGWPRTEPRKRERAKFGATRTETTSLGSHYRRLTELSVAEGIKRVLGELDRLGARSVVVSSNVELRQDGIPYSGRRAPDDCGVAVYFQLKGQPHCFPCDRWDRVADNLAAVAAHVAAMRGMERWGVGSSAQLFSGFKSLPPKGGTTTGEQGAPWWQVLGVTQASPPEVVKAAYRSLASKHHPDAGGNHGAMATINRAWEQAQDQHHG
jgi:hypothetical protein